jgi:acetoin utilization protein AcuB
VAPFAHDLRRFLEPAQILRLAQGWTRHFCVGGVLAVGSILAEGADMNRLAIDQFMTRSPHTIGQDQTLAVAHKMMHENSIRHLPVLDGGALKGIISQRDLEFIESLEDVDPNEVEVSEAMTQDTYTVNANADLAAVAAEMANHKYGSAVVLQDSRVVGVFTTVDALRVLAKVLSER